MLLFILKSFFLFFRALMTNQSTLAAENLALRHQLTLYQRSVKPPHLQRQDRCFWVVLSQLFKDWRSTLIIVQPETVIRWHRHGFALYWQWKSKLRPPGRPQVTEEIRGLIRQMSQENPLWGAAAHPLGASVAWLYGSRVNCVEVHGQMQPASFTDVEKLSD